MKKKPASPPEKTSKKKFSTKKITQVIPKYIITLRILLDRSLIELEALSLYGETCLHSTISTLSNKKGIRFHRKSELHKNRAGGITKRTEIKLLP